MSDWSPREPKWPWRDFLTSDERQVIDKLDELKAEVAKLQGKRTLIQNRAIQRAKYAASIGACATPSPHALEGRKS